MSTPEERARADAINEEISRQAKARRNGTAVPKLTPQTAPAPIPSISRTPREPMSSSQKTTLLICLTITLNVVGFIGYKAYSEHKEREAAKQMIREANEAAEKAMADAMEASTAAAKQITDAFKTPGPAPSKTNQRKQP